MNSALYNCRVSHQRLEPFQNSFLYKVFMFYLDLDEVDAVAKRLWLVSRDRFNVFTFRESDHYHYGSSGLKKSVIDYAKAQGCQADIQRVMLLTHLRTLGHVFNPVSFYFCFDAAGQAVAVVTEVGNTFREMKPYFLGMDRWVGHRFEATIPKYFYVSPFIAHDASFHFKLSVPGDRLSLSIDDFHQEKRFFLSALTGERQALTNAALVGFALRFPFITLQILGLIHWQAFKMILRRIPYFRKAEHPDLQRGYQHVPNR